MFSPLPSVYHLFVLFPVFFTFSYLFFSFSHSSFIFFSSSPLLIFPYLLHAFSYILLFLALFLHLSFFLSSSPLLLPYHLPPPFSIHIFSYILSLHPLYLTFSLFFPPSPSFLSLSTLSPHSSLIFPASLPFPSFLSLSSPPPFPSTHLRDRSKGWESEPWHSLARSWVSLQGLRRRLPPPSACPSGCLLGLHYRCLLLPHCWQPPSPADCRGCRSSREKEWVRERKNIILCSKMSWCFFFRFCLPGN